MDYKIDGTCPWCGYAFGAATSVGPDEIGPEEGSLGVCIQCAGVGVYAFTGEAGSRVLGTRLPIPEEVAGIKADPKALDLVLAARRAVLTVWAQGEFL